MAVLLLAPTAAHAEAEGMNPDSAFEQMVTLGTAMTLCGVDLRGSGVNDAPTLLRSARQETGLSEAAVLERVTRRVMETEDALRADGKDKMFCGELRRVAGGSRPSARATAFERLASAGYTKRKSAPAKDKNLKALVGQWHKANEVCRGTSDDGTMPACDRRDEVSAQLDLVGWCYGKKGQAGYQMKWHACGRGSIRN
jgi:hypothetical protein